MLQYKYYCNTGFVRWRTKLMYSKEQARLCYCIPYYLFKSGKRHLLLIHTSSFHTSPTYVLNEEQQPATATHSSRKKKDANQKLSYRDQESCCCIALLLHKCAKDACNKCWSRNELPSRSLVYDGNVMTLKGHKVLSHVLSDETFRWDLNLDRNAEAHNDFCYPW